MHSITKVTNDSMVVSGMLNTSLLPPTNKVEMSMGTTGIPRVPRDSHGNGSDDECTVGTGTGMGIKAWAWE